MRFVLDTNIVLDWLLFANPATTSLVAAIESSQAQLLASDLSIDELRCVLGYPALKVSRERQNDILAAYSSRVTFAQLPATFSRDCLQLPATFPLCRDADDQHFLALAYHAQATLVTRDKALLKLRKRTQRFGVRIVTLAEFDTLPLVPTTNTE